MVGIVTALRVLISAGIVLLPVGKAISAPGNGGGPPLRFILGPIPKDYRTAHKDLRGVEYGLDDSVVLGQGCVVSHYTVRTARECADEYLGWIAIDIPSGRSTYLARGPEEQGAVGRRDSVSGKPHGGRHGALQVRYGPPDSAPLSNRSGHRLLRMASCGNGLSARAPWRGWARTSRWTGWQGL